ncbi:hypothetical protein CAOG_009400 [Capsaspora owczarzaki ATCC 30864]|uniref:Homeobox domain-containing protein n=1 Tax=Capsaspora owczarzaki (strain ATCC 30864) TaxID=595528 RepID=A0A0D2X0Y4_CAPO3|nr:hypothetical protein CAOG_009400 [Capsaspora owczarzaki ATCC 30864]
MIENRQAIKIGYVKHCNTCGRKIAAGETFALKGQLLYCKADYDQLAAGLTPSSSARSSAAGLTPGGYSDPPLSPSSRHSANFPGLQRQFSAPTGSPPHALERRASGSAADQRRLSNKSARSSLNSIITDPASPLNGLDSDGMPKRVRTKITPEQMDTLMASFELNMTPDAATRERLAAITGLSIRVIQVWFQNKRATYKKKRDSGLAEWAPISGRKGDG